MGLGQYETTQIECGNIFCVSERTKYVALGVIATAQMGCGGSVEEAEEVQGC